MISGWAVSSQLGRQAGSCRDDAGGRGVVFAVDIGRRMIEPVTAPARRKAPRWPGSCRSRRVDRHRDDRRDPLQRRDWRADAESAEEQVGRQGLQRFRVRCVEEAEVHCLAKALHRGSASMSASSTGRCAARSRHCRAPPSRCCSKASRVRGGRSARARLTMRSAAGHGRWFPRPATGRRPAAARRRRPGGG